MQRWTGDRWTSTLHRAVAQDDVPPRRRSLVFSTTRATTL
jgi:isopenicillin N synthase-like dioxygenase